jgi:hypothetical protein
MLNIKALIAVMTSAIITYDEDDIECDGCCMVLGYGTRTNKLVLCNQCGPHCCSTDTLILDGSPEYWAMIGHRMEASKMERVEWDRYKD